MQVRLCIVYYRLSCWSEKTLKWATSRTMVIFLSWTGQWVFHQAALLQADFQGPGSSLLFHQIMSLIFLVCVKAAPLCPNCSQQESVWMQHDLPRTSTHPLCSCTDEILTRSSSSLQGRLGNVVQLWSQDEGEDRREWKANSHCRRYYACPFKEEANKAHRSLVTFPKARRRKCLNQNSLADSPIQLEFFIFSLYHCTCHVLTFLLSHSPLSSWESLSQRKGMELVNRPTSWGLYTRGWQTGLLAQFSPLPIL